MESKVDEESQLNMSMPEPLELDESYQTPKEIHWGKCLVMMKKGKNASIVIGPHWPLFICAYLLFFGASVFLIIWEFTNANVLIRWLTVLVCGNQCFSYMWVALKNPGVANQENAQVVDSKKKQTWYCEKCKLVQFMKTVHCSDCDVCIVDLDHHCPWTGKCIGRGNLFQFYYFLVSTLIFMIFNIIVSVTQLDNQLKK